MEVEQPPQLSSIAEEEEERWMILGWMMSADNATAGILACYTLTVSPWLNEGMDK